MYILEQIKILIEKTDSNNIIWKCISKDNYISIFVDEDFIISMDFKCLSILPLNHRDHFKKYELNIQKKCNKENENDFFYYLVVDNTINQDCLNLISNLQDTIVKSQQIQCLNILKETFQKEDKSKKVNISVTKKR
jgi:hypothetical protein